MLGFPILYCMGMRPMMFQLSGFCYKGLRLRTAGASKAFGSLGFRDGVCGFPRTSGVDRGSNTVDDIHPALP